jgi:hypothetical protein
LIIISGFFELISSGLIFFIRSHLLVLS